MEFNKHHISEEEFELIEKYLQDELSPEEKKGIDSKINSDPIFFQKYKEIKALIQGIEEESLKEELEHFHLNLGNSTFTNPFEIKKSGSSFFNYGIAASIVFLLGFGFWFLMSPNNNQKLYDQHFVVDPGLPTTMGETEHFQFYDAMVNYKQQHYDKAIDKWEQIHKEKQNNDTLNYYLGMAYMAKDEQKKAIQYLDKVIIANESTFKDQAYFYLGLAYLRNDEVEKSKIHLAKSKQESSQSLLEKLND